MNRESEKRDARPRVGLGLIIRRENRVLLGQRIGSHGEGSYSFPGGHIEYFEDLIQTAQREGREEIGPHIKYTTPKPAGVFTNDIFPKEEKHFITIYMLADHVSGEPRNMEPHKCKGWAWYEWNDLPSPLFTPVQNLVKQGYNPFTCK